MIFEEVFASLPTTGWLTLEEADLLWNYATTMTGDILEIGTYCGRSAKLLASALLDTPSRTLHCCDPVIAGFDGVNTPSRYEIFISIVQHVLIGPASGQVCFHCTTEKKLRELWNDRYKLGIVYIDGDHSKEATLGAIERWFPLTKRIIFHDYGGNHKGVGEAIRAYGLKNRFSLAGRVAVFEGGLA